MKSTCILASPPPCVWSSYETVELLSVSCMRACISTGFPDGSQHSIKLCEKQLDLPLQISLKLSILLPCLLHLIACLLSSSFSFIN